MAHIACLHCDLLVQTVDLQSGEHAVCPRCHQTLYLDQRSFNTSIALLLTALLIYFPAVLLPFLQMETAGQTRQVSLLTSVTTIAHSDMLLLSATVFALVLLFPLLKILGLLSIMLPLSRDKLPFFGVVPTRWLIGASPWSMVEVYLVGVLVTLVKLTGIASVDFSGGFYAFILLIVINAVISVRLPHKRIWQSIAALKRAAPQYDTAQAGQE